MSIRRVGSPAVFPLFPQQALPEGFLHENGTYLCELEAGVGNSAELELAFNGVLADHLLIGGKHIYRFTPGFYAGEVSIAVFASTKLLGVTDQTISPAHAKLTRQDYAQLLEELAAATLALFRMSGVTVPAPGAASAPSSTLVTLELVRANFDRWYRSVSRIADQPLRALGTVNERVDVLRARRIVDRSFAQAFRRGEVRPASIWEAKAAPGLVQALRGQWVPEISQQRRQEHASLFENRAIVGFCRWLLTLFAKAHLALESDSDLSSSVWRSRMSRWRAQVLALLQRDVFRDLSPEPHLRSTSAFRMHPEYSSAFDAMMRIRGGLGAGSHLIPAIPIDRTFQLYELWCYVRLLEAVGRKYPSSIPDIRQLLLGLESPDKLGAVLAQGEPSRIQLTSELTMTYQRRFTSVADPEGCRTLLIEAVPDVVLSKRLSGGEASAIVILDPKYRSGPALMEGVRDLHVYRDSILNSGSTRLTAAAAVLAPRPSLSDGLPLRTDRPTVVRAWPGGPQNQFDDILGASEEALA